MKDKNLNRRTFFKGVGLAASAAWLSGCATTSHGHRVGGKNSHKILCANIRVPIAADEKTGDGWNTRKDLCADVIEAEGADLICLQECFGIQLDYLKSRLRGYDHYGLSHPEPIYKPGNAILYSSSRYQLISSGGFWLSETPHIAGSKGWDSDHGRFVNWVDLKDRRTGVEFRLWNTHFDHKGQIAREEQARVLCEGVEAARPKDFPQLLTGDMNADMRNKAIIRLKERGWIDTYAAVHGPKDPGNTFHRFLGVKYPEAKPSSNGKIDWIFARGKIQTLAAEIVRKGRDGRYPSDHYFVSAEVLIGDSIQTG